MGAHIETLITVGSAAGGLVSLLMAGVAWRNRDMPAAPAFALLMASISGWSFVAAASFFVNDVATAYLLDRLSRLLAAHVSPLLLLFVLSYAGYTRWLEPKWIAAYWLSPTVYLLLSLTGPWHELASGPGDVEIVTAGGITAPTVRDQVATDVHVTVAYVLVLASFAVLFHFYRRSRTTHRRQITLIAVGVFVPLLANLAFTTGTALHPGIDLTPVTFTVTGVVMGWALFRYDFLDAAPVATEVLVEQLPDPVLVVDEDGEVVDHNPAALDVFGDDGLVGRAVTDAAPGLMEHLESDDVYSLSDRRTTDGGSARFYDPQVSSIDDHHGRERGRLIVLRDVTGQQRRQDRLEALQAATQQFITATAQDEIARLTVDFVEQALDRHAAGVFLADGDTLRPAAVTDAIREFYDDEELVLDRDSVAFETFEAGERRVETVEDGSPIQWYTVIPLGDHGVLGIGSRDDDPLASDDEQFATILARTTQVALTQVERERELRRSRAAVERRSEQIEFFNGILRHTLRNALLVIQGRTGHLRDHLGSDHHRHLDVIVEWCDDLATLSDEIRAINDTVTATESERLDVVDLTVLLRDRARDVEAEFPDVEVTLDVHDDLAVQANELLGRVVKSVILNAVDHNDSGEPSVEITTRRAADRVLVQVADDGPGMPEAMKDSVFERDLTTSQTSHGFGLYFVSVMMNLYGGTVWFEDNEPHGTIACLEFQAVEEDE